MMNETIIFILNPISGFLNFRRYRVRRCILKAIRNRSIKGEIRYSKYAGHAYDIACEAVKEGYKYVAVAGGDGSINEVARALVNTDVAMGIIPAGSGNGLARHLKIPFKIQKALEVINNKKVRQADILKVNDDYAASLAGIGFDAIVADRYAKDKRRGFLTYVQSAMIEYVNFQPEAMIIKTDELEISEDLFFVVLANSNQFGYNFKIAPHADLFDGFMDVVILKDLPIVAAPLSSIQIFTGHADDNLFISMFKTKKITIIRKQDGIVNIDGDPRKTNKIIEAQVIEKGLRIIVP